MEGRKRAFANPRYLFSLSLDAMGGKTERLLCTLALAASPFSSLEWRLRQDKQNHVAVSLILIDRSCICLISMRYGGLSNVQLLHINLISNTTVSELTFQTRISIHYKRSDSRLFRARVLSMTFSLV